MASSRYGRVIAYFGIRRDTFEIFIIEVCREEPERILVVSRFKKFIKETQVYPMMNSWYQELPDKPWVEMKRPVGSGPAWTGARKKLREQSFEARDRSSFII